MRLPPPGFTVGWVCFCWCNVFSLCKICLVCCPKSSNLVSSFILGNCFSNSIGHSVSQRWYSVAHSSSQTSWWPPSQASSSNRRQLGHPIFNLSQDINRLVTSLIGIFGIAHSKPVFFYMQQTKSSISIPLDLCYQPLVDWWWQAPNIHPLLSINLLSQHLVFSC